MTRDYPPGVQELLETFFTRPGATPGPERRTIAAAATALGGAPSAGGKVPAAAAGYLEKVALHAYKVTDEDIAALKVAGYSEDQILEMTLSSALGAGLARLDLGLRAIRGGR